MPRNLKEKEKEMWNAEFWRECKVARVHVSLSKETLGKLPFFCNVLCQFHFGVCLGPKLCLRVPLRSSATS